MSNKHPNAADAAGNDLTPAAQEAAIVEARLATHYKPLGLRAVAAAEAVMHEDKEDEQAR
ncbi:hypothetical protein [Pseudoxanthobacter sp.]|uniref:hypothetical protein n=1 Tax=Pseudoxanthobacter sp. TaxID=1925742 RepID=UPI002FE15B53